MRSPRLLAGALLYDAIPFEWRLRRDWVSIRHRGEPVTRDPHGLGVRIDAKWASSLHYTRVFPEASRRLLRRALRDWPIDFAPAPRPSTAPDVSFLIGHRGTSRLPLLLATLETIAAQRDAAVECIVVEQSSRAEAREVLPSWVRYVHTPVAEGEPYRRGSAFNEAARLARGRALVPHDNDILVPTHYAAEALRQLEAGRDALDLKRFLFYFDAAATARALRERVVDAVSYDVVQNVRGGSIAITRDAFDAIGGFDDAFSGWGGEDSEFWERAETLRASTFAHLPMIHLWHEPQPEKARRDVAPAVARYHEVAQVPPAERIAALRAKRS